MHKEFQKDPALGHLSCLEKMSITCYCTNACYIAVLSELKESFQEDGEGW